MLIKRPMIFLAAFVLVVSCYGIIWSRLSPSSHFPKQFPILVEPNEKLPGQQELSAGTSFNTLILGIDAWEQEAARTDLIMLVNINTVSKQVRIVSLPRDTRVELPGVGWTKINHAHMIAEVSGGNKAGTQAALQAVSNLLHCSINYYAKIDFAGFEHFIDTIGGLPLELPAPVKLSHKNILLPQGEQILDGKLARELVRERYSLPNGDFGRQKLHLLVLKALAYKLLSSENISKLPGLITQAQEDLVDTNFTESDIFSLAWLFQGVQEDDVTYTQLPGQSGYAYDPLVKGQVYYWYPDLNRIGELAEKYLN